MEASTTVEHQGVRSFAQESEQGVQPEAGAGSYLHHGHAPEHGPHIERTAGPDRTGDHGQTGEPEEDRVDGAPAGNTNSVIETDRMQRIDELFNMLKAKRELWKQTHPNKDFPGVAMLQIDQNIPAVVVKSVFQTAAFAGFPNVSFMVDKLPQSGAH